MNDMRATVAPGRLRQMQIYVTGAGGKRPAVPVAHDLLEQAAARKMTPQAAAYIIGGAGGEATMRANRAAFERRQIAPRVLRDVSSRDLSVTLFGRWHSAPILLAPVGVLEMVHPEADLAVARAAAAEGVGYVFSNQASMPMERAAGAIGNASRWFQLYWSSDDDFVRSVVGRAERCGCEAIVVTLDTTLLGWRPRDLDMAYLPFLRGLGLAQYLSDPVFRTKIPASPPDTGVKPAGLDIVSTALSLRRKGKGRNCRSCSRAFAMPTMRGWRGSMVLTASSFPTMAAGRWTARLRHWTRCRRLSPRRAGCRSCSIRAFVRAAMSPRRWRLALRRCWSAGLMSMAWRLPARRACARLSATSSPSST